MEAQSYLTLIFLVLLIIFLIVYYDESSGISFTSGSSYN